ncbi:tripartite tricarboxylate transporter substrate binding protein [Pseudorhodoferax sp.]|uniref:tripartite tricarboxylate transporter substrate binding protein n=1 Tax=Pseudorhodoferax sp. TaxID=1993553 RepID=UPI002DD65407|nr:tripartite tricarboxylate transporter substrate binding protein [Pseudorhodoferax sp.]
MNRALFLRWLAALSAAPAASLPLAAQPAYPNRPITFKVPYAPGGPTDVSSRVIADELSRRLGQPVVVSNRPGAATAIGTELVKAGPADGYTLLLGSSTTFSLNPLQYKKLNYRLEDFEPIGAIADVPYVLVVNNNLPVRNVQEFIAWSQARPEGFTFGTVGQGSSTHIAGLMLAKAINAKGVPVHYKGSSNVQADLLAGVLDAAVDPLVTSLQMHKSGKARIIATVGARRSSDFPDVPTLAEQGVRSLDTVPATFGVLVRAGTPAPIVARLRQALAAVIADPAVKTRLRTLGLEASAVEGEDFSRLLRTQEAWYRREIEESKIQFAE